MSNKSHRGRRPSLSSPMSWLSRSSSSSNHIAPYGAAIKPMRISEPKLYDQLTYPRNGTLGTGAVVVRTPQEALAGSGVAVDYTSDPEPEEKESDESDEEEADHDEQEPDAPSEEQQDAGKPLPPVDTPVPPAYSPPRPSLPLSKSTPTLPLKDASVPARPNRPPPPPPAATEPPVRVAPKAPLASPPMSSYFPPVPPLPSHVIPPSLAPPFECILLSSVPSNAIDLTKVIVTLETCTAIHRTTLTTLTSRPSHLADYLKSVFAMARDPEDTPVDSASDCSPAQSSFNSIFHQHLTASGLIPGSASNIHIFLDRPSASYDHILTFLRSPPTTFDHTSTLPHAVQLQSYSTARVDALVALRDEARYLGLDELCRLCGEELLARQPHMRGNSSGSIRSMHTLRERDEETEEAHRDSVGSSGSMHSSGSGPRSHSRERTDWKETPSATLRSRSKGNWL
ncbi:hypothetical protein BV25DRAFT_1833909 [Artomyces pyxidatus]|uniref:Uncharacterized protein n=1 Tax=Artomyces pyxidatus TaxID=48021 RepID=A0ACB8TJT9_9AGAM|nr:hypothetical protein BV25DRAFT_1833909 [Artomyces pyxidatus]